ncbi:MAG TPA: hypothetical protein VKY19_05700 [Ktedonosporobacter sp.]|jgi:hypothetical protein|nr:hypothetical protein [Ktedonosporobacter sp.]
MLASVQKDGRVIVPIEKGVVHSGKGFTDGVVCGYLEYHDTHAGKPLSDGDIYIWINDALEDSRYDAIWLAGYIVRWCEGLERRQGPIRTSQLASMLGRDKQKGSQPV